MAASTEVEGSAAAINDVPTLPFAQMTSQFMQSVKDNFAANNIQGYYYTTFICYNNKLQVFIQD